MMHHREALGLNVRLETDFETALSKVTDALRVEGFGVLTEIDVKDTLKSKLDVEFRPYRILGACNPPLAYRALSAVPEVGLLLPCNVTVAQAGDDRIEVAILDPMLMADVIGHPALEQIGMEAKERLERVVAALKEG